MLNKKLSFAASSLVVLTLASCGTPMSNNTTTSSAPYGTYNTSGASSVASGYGVVQAIDVVNNQNAGIGLGTVAGAVVGGVLGNQVGKGNGNTAATVAGAAGGAYAGHQLEKQSSAQNAQTYRITLRMDDGSLQTYNQDVQPNIRVGDRVRVANGIVERY